MMFQMVSGDSCQCTKHTKQMKSSEIGVRHVTYTVSGCKFVIRYQNVSNLEVNQITKKSQID